MSKREGYSIGEFSRGTGTTIRTLQYYDEIGLLKPEKNVSSGHRVYKGKDILELQKIVSLKVLGYSLEEISVMLKMPSLNVSLKETLEQQRKAFEEKRKQIEVSIKALERTMVCLKEDEELDSDILMSLINSIQKETEQRLWLEEYVSKETVDGLYNKPEEESLALDKEFVRLAKEVKRLFGRQIEDSEVQKLVDEHMKATLKYVGEETMYSLGKLENAEEQYNNMMPSPYTEEEEAWLNEAMGYYMIRNGLYSPPK
ncbi:MULTISPECIES: MerR family transcriptional regulator [Bacillus]|jgi:DNA-binding transcriptional MerR regulator|uniref:Transcriptional regulator, MerR family n=2 Tax=Bacillus cereus group TaxID=86661 RepID=Q72YK0_BACC1|nr:MULTISPECIES: MerR family transcriptional regulator [Bacillus]AAS43922.1 transcriptional regulator, MerR family [Bacillus cereus ATCC 10987]KMQ35370.1 MerR family transcriptional regulator [Bacillus cereus]KXY76165.1 MerR family transcriptional regulator [Bacillus cereus]MCU5159354.1 MerR family transcriptional regulator [Bacillus pacificus]MCU9943029.1 MerR family transcriptional regulator [Bacillus pacificus]